MTISQEKPGTEKKFDRVLQTGIPRSTLKEALAIAEALRDDFAGKDATPIDLAKSLHRSPTSSSWRILTGAAVAYGLTDNAYNASKISLTSLGAQIVSPIEEGADKEGLMIALLRPSILKTFYEKYNSAKFPKEEIAKNVLRQYGVPQDRTEEAMKIVLENAKFVGVMTEVGGSQYIQLRTPSTHSTETRTRAESSEKVVTNDTPTRSQRELNETAVQSGFTPIRVAEGRMVLDIPIKLRDQILEGDDQVLHDDWRKLRAEMKKFADNYIPDTFPTNETSESKKEAEGG